MQTLKDSLKEKDYKCNIMKSSEDFNRVTKKRKSDVDSTSSLRILSYRLLNNHVQFLYPRLGEVEKSLKQAMIPIPFEVFVCSMVFFSIIAGVIGLGIGIVVSLVVEIQPAAFAFLLPIIAGAGMAQMIHS